MTIGLALTVAFVILKLIGVIHWSWWLVVLPELIEVGIGVIAFGIWALVTTLGVRSVVRRF